MNSPLLQQQRSQPSGESNQNNDHQYAELRQLAGTRIDPFAQDLNSANFRSVGPLTIPGDNPRHDPRRQEMTVAAGTPLTFSDGVQANLNRPDQHLIRVTGESLRPQDNVQMVINPDGSFIAQHTFAATIDYASIYFPGENPDKPVRFMGLPAVVQKGSILGARPLQMAV